MTKVRIEDALKLKNQEIAVDSREIEKKNIEANAATVQREKEEAIANVYEMAGKIKATNFQKVQATLFNLLLLKQVKDSKDYRTKMGMTWEKFCDYVGADRRRIDEELVDLKPFKAEFFGGFANFTGVTYSKIKYIGESISGGFAEIDEKGITIAGQIIPFKEENLDEIQTILKAREEEQQKKTENLEAALSAQKKVAASKEDLINKQERELKRMAKTVELSELTDEEQDAINLLTEVQFGFERGILDIKKKIKPHEAPEIALRCYYFLLLFIGKRCTDECERLNETYPDAGECPWAVMDEEIPNAAVMIDGLPSFAGQGVDVLYQAKLDARKAKAEARKKGKGAKAGEPDPTMIVFPAENEHGDNKRS